jgi:hypothetical protein
MKNTTSFWKVFKSSAKTGRRSRTSLAPEIVRRFGVMPKSTSIGSPKKSFTKKVVWEELNSTIQN